MNAQTLARQAYAASAATTRTTRGTEYELIARVTHRIKAAAEAGPSAFPRLAEALYDNRRLWTTLAIDVSNEKNGLPPELRARIFFLSEFVQDHTRRVLTRKASVRAILEINTAILRGLGASGGER